MNVPDLLAVALATSAASVTISKTKITHGFRQWLWSKPKLSTIAYMFDCPYCISHWIALFLVAGMVGYPFPGLIPFIVVLGAVIALAAMSTGVIMHLMVWNQRDVDELRAQLDEAHKMIGELVKD